MKKIAGEIEWLVNIFRQSGPRPTPENVSKIKLNQLVSKLGFFYEKLRNAVDYNEEHLIRRNSLTRLLNRQLFFLQEKDAKKISQTIIYEFIRAKYLPNDSLPETIIDELSAVIQKYLELFRELKRVSPEADKHIRWLIGVAAAELNEGLGPMEKENATANVMYSHLVDNLVFTKNHLDEKEKNLQIYLATLRTLNKADAVALRYQLLKLHYPDWKNLPLDQVGRFAADFPALKNKIEKNIAHPLGFQLARVVRPESIFFSLLSEIMKQNQVEIREILSDPEKLEEKIKEVARANYQRIRGKLLGTIARVIIYILLTKTILAFIVELPYDYFILQHINWRALTINVVFHPLLMFFLAMTIRVPGEKNTTIIVSEIKKIVYGDERKTVFKPKGLLKRGSAGYFIFNSVYLAMFLISFGLVVKVLHWLNFNIISGFLFVFFLTIVSFFGFRLRHFAKQLSVVPRKDNFINFVVDFLSLPIIRVGRFFSTNFAKVNVFLFILDFLIETPFKILVEFLESAVSFINEKREEIVE